ncbi:MAG: tetratricopeptide repeat protein [Bryobacteraceae bacterium]
MKFGLFFAGALCAQITLAGDSSLTIADDAAKALSARDYAGAVRMYREALAENAANPEYQDALGMALAGLGQLSDAIGSVNRALAIEERPTFYYHLGLLSIQTGDRRNGIRALENAIRLDRDAWEAKYALSEQCSQAGDLEGAILSLEQVVHQRPRLAIARLDLALTWMQLERNDQESLRQLLVATTIEPENPRTHLALGEVYAGRNDYDRAIRELKRAVDLDPGNPEGHYNLGLAWRLDGRLDQAELELQRALDLKPGHALAHKALGLVLREKDNLAGARDQLLESVNADAGDAEAQHLLGSVLLKLGDAESATHHLLAAVRLNPVLTEAYSVLAAAYGKLGRADDASQARSQAEASREIKARAGQSIILLQESNQRRSAGDKAGAVSALRRAIQLSPEFSEGAFQLATLLSTSVDSAVEAEHLYRRVVEINPKYAKAYVGLGAILLRTKRDQEGESVLRHALEMAPSVVEAHLELGKLALTRKNFAEAASEYGAALAWQPDNTDARVQRGRALAGGGSYKAAELELKACVLENPSADAYHYLGVVLERTGRRSEATAAFRASQQLKYNNPPY